MELGLAGKRAIVCASSRGLGKGCAEALAAEGVDIVINGRTADTLHRTADAIAQAHGVSVTPVVADIATDEGQAAVLVAAGNVDILINNAGGPPPGDYRDWGREEWLGAVEQNMLTPILLMKAVLPGMIDRGWGRIVNITSVSVKAPIPELGLSNGARAGLTGFVAGVSRQVARHGVTINNLMPGPFETDRLTSNFKNAAEKTGKSVEQIASARRESNPSRRFGQPDEFGAYCAFLCSQHAGYVTGQNLLMDGGGYPGTL
jgi:3-oxoacyl-[acyl-carrier protein] reductase